MKTNVKKELLGHIFLILSLIICLWPIIFLLSASFKDLNQIFQYPLNPLPENPTWANYTTVLERFPIFQFTGNTFFIAITVTLFKIITSLLAGFGFVYYRFKGREFLFNSMVLTFFIPMSVLIMPNYLLISSIGLLDTAFGVILVEMVDGMGIFLMRQTMRSIPKSIFESAILEGASPLYILWHIIMPLVRPSIISISIMFFINAWNEYFWPLLILKSKSEYTLALALPMFISAEGGSEWGLAMALAVLTSLLPFILFIICQKYILNTFIQAGVKG
ncbi:carbohydrate ABC transporter permease [Veillonella criceti]|uniref:Inner membrane ABC transporter permease protein ycjP n=1 Tax=Veillonella criceti TaxID=103891 RepID=A0A380NLS0_9FIRM|nr:carbohydrate ABC transporter permease [Veillonella criceti]SUP43891.1 Inner membrane ABC transporter permease protein ycjP [Veillonella criceti]